MYYSYSLENYPSLIDFLNEKISEKIPFCVLRLPNRDNFMDSFIVQVPDMESSGEYRIAIKVKPWLSGQWFDFSTTGNPTVEPMPVCPESTPEEQYLDSVSELIEILKKRGGKTVICRNICGEFSQFDLGRLFKSYVDATAGKDRVSFLLWHPEMNFWMGSTPELILERRNDGTFRTIALAGTRSSSIKYEWDLKNLKEHNLVVNDIENRLKLTGINFFRTPIKELEYGPVTHLMTEIVSEFVENGHDRKFFDSMVEEIEPTPALAGYPRPFALSEIDRFERWPRFLYAGCLNITDIRHNMTYGIIRCVHFDNHNWAIYTGSGVTADSFASVEWAETEAKAAPLLECLRKI